MPPVLTVLMRPRSVTRDERSLCCWLAAATFIGLLAAAAPALAEGPTRTTNVLVPYAAGGNTDTMARILAQKLSAKFGGILSSSTIAWARAARSRRRSPRGRRRTDRTLLFGSAAQIAVIPKIQHGQLRSGRR